MSFDIKFTRLGFENTCSRCQPAFSKPCLANLISKDTHLVFSISFICREESSPPADPKFIVTLDGVDPRTYEVISENRPQNVQVGN